MPTLVLTNPYVLINGVTLTSYVRQVTIQSDRELHDDTAGSSVTARQYAPGINNNRMTTVFNFVLGAGAVEATLWAIHNAGTAVAFTVGYTGSTAGTATPTFSGSALLEDFTIDGEIGQKMEMTVPWQITGGLTHNVS